MRLKLSKELSLPVDVVTEKLAWLGRTGSGKTYGAMKLAELMLDANAQVGVIDPVGVWQALRVPVKKGQTAYPVYVFGGLYGDLPLEPNASAGALVADIVTDNHIPFVLDVSQWIPSEQQRFVCAFIGRLFQRRKAAPAAMHLFVEECQEFAPQNPQGSEIDTLHVFQRLWKLGRNFGFGGSLISQRPQEINKKLLNMTGTMFCFQMTGPQERDAVKKWVVDAGVASDITSMLPRLERGHAHVERVEDNFSAEIAILPRVTADLSSTPKVGAGAAAKRELSPIDVERVSVALAATIEEQKANDPKELKQAVTTAKAESHALKLALDTAKKQITVLQGRKAVQVPAIKDADLKRVEKIVNRIDADRAALIGALGPVATALAALAAAQRPAATSLGPMTRAVVAATASRQRPAVPVQVTKQASVDSGWQPPLAHGDLPGGELATLRAVVQFGQITRPHLELQTGYKRSSRKQFVSRLTAKGYVESTAEHVIATKEGIARLLELGHDIEPLPTGDALYRWWLERLPAGEQRALRAIHDSGADGIGVHQLEVTIGCQKSSRKQFVSRLARRGLVRPSGGKVRISGLLVG